jgi:cation:H+ antiporter
LSRGKAIFFIALAATVGLPGLYVRFAHPSLGPQVTVVLAGVGIMGASFLLLWACDAAQSDIPQTLALAVVALIAVLPEYAVSMYFTWQAGKNPAGGYAQYAVANMTGANRLLIGVAWAAVAVICWLKTRQPVRLEPERRLELRFLGLATLYAFVIPLKGSLAWYDGVVLLGIYGWYVAVASKRPVEESEAEGPARVIMALPALPRRLATAGLFLFSALVIVANAAPFSEGLLATGRLLHINEFLLVQWLAPIASEMPEFVVALMFAWRLRAGLGLGSLLSSKVNQWTLLVGMIPWAFALATGQLGAALPMGSLQMNEILLTAAQSLLAVVMLAGLRLTLLHGLVLFVLFAAQLLSPGWTHGAYAAVYVALAVGLAVARPRRLANLWPGKG